MCATKMSAGSGSCAWASLFVQAGVVVPRGAGGRSWILHSRTGNLVPALRDQRRLEAERQPRRHRPWPDLGPGKLWDGRYQVARHASLGMRTRQPELGRCRTAHVPETRRARHSNLDLPSRWEDPQARVANTELSARMTERPHRRHLEKRSRRACSYGAQSSGRALRQRRGTWIASAARRPEGT